MIHMPSVIKHQICTKRNKSVLPICSLEIKLASRLTLQNTVGPQLLLLTALLVRLKLVGVMLSITLSYLYWYIS